MQHRNPHYQHRVKGVLGQGIAIMDAVIQLQIQFHEYITSLYREEYLDDQFKQLQKLQDESNPDFVVEVVSLFFEDSEKLLNNLATALQQENVDYKQVDAHVHQFKGSSSSIGAKRVRDVCIAFRNYCDAKNLDGCVLCLQQAKNEYIFIRNKLQALFNRWQNGQLDRLTHGSLHVTLEQQLIQAGGSVPMMA